MTNYLSEREVSQIRTYVREEVPAINSLSEGEQEATIEAAINKYEIIAAGGTSTNDDRPRAGINHGDPPRRGESDRR